MPEVKFTERTTAEVKVSGRTVTSAPPVTLPVGPRDFPLPPPPPPPPVVALGIASVTITNDNTAFTTVTFDAEYDILGIVNWRLTGDNITVAKNVTVVSPTSVLIEWTRAFFTSASTMTVPASSLGIYSKSGGAVTSGVYDVN